MAHILHYYDIDVIEIIFTFTNKLIIFSLDVAFPLALMNDGINIVACFNLLFQAKEKSCQLSMMSQT
jgi:hypothetical protein